MMKRIGLSFCCALLAGYTAAQDGAVSEPAVETKSQVENVAVENKEKSPWIPAMTISITHASRDMSDGGVGNPDAVNVLGFSAEWGIAENFAFHAGGEALIDETDFQGQEDNVSEWKWNAGLSFELPDVAAIGTLAFSVDYYYYNHPRDGSHKHTDDQKEYEIAVNASDLFLSPGIAFVHEFENNVVSGNLNVTYERSLENICEKLSFECPVELWIGNSKYTGCTDGTAVSSLAMEPTVVYDVNENVSLAVFLQLGWGIDGHVRDSWKDDENSSSFNMCWGINLTANF